MDSGSVERDGGAGGCGSNVPAAHHRKRSPLSPFDWSGRVAVLFVLSFLRGFNQDERLKPLPTGCDRAAAGAVRRCDQRRHGARRCSSATARQSARDRVNEWVQARHGRSSITSLVTTSTSTSSGTTSKRVKILLGSLLLAGGLVTAAVQLVRFLKKKVDYSGDRWKTLLLGFVLSAMIGAAVPLLITSTASAASPLLNSATFPAHGHGCRRVCVTPGPQLTETGWPPQPPRSP